MKKVILVLALLVLTGCASTKSTVVEVQDTKVVKVGIPTHLLKDCVPPAKIPEAAFMAMNPDERETAMTDYSIKLLKVIKVCNTQIKAIRALNHPQSSDPKHADVVEKK